MNQFLNKLERRFGSWAVPGLIRYMAILFVGCYLLSGFLPHLWEVMDFDYQKVIQGEVWRLVTFVFAPHAAGFSMMGLLFCFFGMMLSFVFSDALEAQWGVFRANLYVYGGFLSAIVAAVLLGAFFGYKPTLPGAYLGLSIYFAFATYNPRFTLMLFFVIPTPIWITAAVIGFLVGMGVLGGFTTGNYASSIFILAALLNFFVVAIPYRFSQMRMQRGSMKRRKKFEVSSRSDDEAFHRCSVCNATDVSHPDYDFRVGKDGEDYCTNHLPKS